MCIHVVNADFSLSLEIKDGFKGFRAFHLNELYLSWLIQSLLKALKKELQRNFVEYSFKDQGIKFSLYYSFSLFYGTLLFACEYVD